MTDQRFAGKTAVVLGASAEGGSGWAIAERLAQEGAKVVVAARTLPELERLAGKIGGFAVRCDAGEPDDIKQLADITHEKFGPIDLAINAAGWTMPGFVSGISPDDARQAVAVNYLGPLFFTQHCARVMKDGGSIAIITSIAATHVAPGVLAYACAKAATNQMVRYAAVEYGPRRIRVNAVVPAFIESAMSAPMRAMPGVLEAVLKEVPLGRAALPADIAAACLWLASDECFATGVLLPIDGGNHLRRCTFPDEFAAGAYESIGD
jgi:NAD(P)-dependent dehydrogenase (short-subunit alcohol dehydrogenase family)